MMYSPAGSQRIMWWFSGRSRRLRGGEQGRRQGGGARDGRIELCEEGCLRLCIWFMGRGEVWGKLLGRGVGAAGGGHGGACRRGGFVFQREQLGYVNTISDRQGGNTPEAPRPPCAPRLSHMAAQFAGQIQILTLAVVMQRHARKRPKQVRSTHAPLLCLFLQV